jgi:quinol monooxygenase YgiN
MCLLRTEVVMFVRIDDVTVGAGRVDELRDVLSNNAPVMIGQEGCEGLSCSADRATGSCAIVSLWDSKRSLERSAHTIAAIRTATVEAVDAELEGIVIAEVLREFKVRPTHVGAQARVVRIAAPAGKADGLVDFYDAEVVPRLRSQPGFLNSLLIRDLEHHGRFSAVSHWTDADALKSSDTSTAVREQITKTGAAIERISTSEIILADRTT